MDQLASTPSAQTYTVYPKRFIVAALFCLVQMMTSVMLNTLTAIAAYLVIIYELDPIVINLGALLFTLMHPIFTFPAAYVIDTYGTRIGIALGCFLGLVGVCLRMLVNHGFAWVIVGQVIAGIGRPFILNCQAKVSANWFTAETRGGVTQIFMLVLNTSLILGIFIPGIVFGSYKPDISIPGNIQEGQDLTFNVMLVEAIMAAVCFGLNIIFQDDKPPTPPSASSGIVREPFSTAIPKLFKNWNYVFLLMAFGCYFGIFNGMSIVLSFLLEPWFGGDDLPIAVGLVGGSPIISGILGVAILGNMQRKTKDYKKFIVICMLGSSLAMILFFPLLQTDSLFWASFISAFNSFFLFPLVPIMLELSCEIAFPVGEGSAVGLLLANGNLFGAILGLFLSLIVQGQSKGQTAAGLGFCFGIFLIGLVLIYFMKEELNRYIFETQSSEKSERSVDEHSSGQDSSQSRGSQLTTGKSDGLQQKLMAIGEDDNSIL